MKIKKKWKWLTYEREFGWLMHTNEPKWEKGNLSGRFFWNSEDEGVISDDDIFELPEPSDDDSENIWKIVKGEIVERKQNV